MLYDDFSLAFHELLARNFSCDTCGNGLWVSRLRINRAHSITDYAATVRRGAEPRSRIRTKIIASVAR